MEMDVDRGRPIHPRLTSNPSFHFTPFLLLVNQVVDVGRSILREDDMGDEIVFVMKGMDSYRPTSDVFDAYHSLFLVCFGSS